MNAPVSNASRHVAAISLLASAAFFAWWGLAIATSWPESVPFFGGVVVAWVVAALGVHRGRVWGPGFAAGLSVLSVASMLPAGLRAPVAVFLVAQVVLLSALTVRIFAAPGDPSAWRHTGLAFAAGLAAPFLALVGLLPGLVGGSALLGLGALVVGAVGVAAAFRGRTWGLFAMLGAVPLLLAVPAVGGTCFGGGPHDRAGELAAIALVLGLGCWAGPVARYLRR